LAQKIENQVRAYYKLPADVGISVGPLRPSEFPNYDALTVTLDNREKKQTVEFLVAKDQKTLIRIAKIDMTKDPYEEVMKKIDLSNRPVRGNANAKVTVVNFDDFQCPFCSRMHQALFPNLLKEYGDRVKFVYKDFPLLDLHPWALHSAVDANCLAAQSGDAYWDFADYIHANQREVNSEESLKQQFVALDRITTLQGQKHNVDQAKLQSCMKAQMELVVRAEIKEGEDLDLSATPVLFVNGQELEGAVPVPEIRAALDAALTRAGVPTPKPAAPQAPAAEAKPGGK
jgi:protein-disulfide isomerase